MKERTVTGEFTRSELRLLERIFRPDPKLGAEASLRTRAARVLSLKFAKMHSRWKRECGKCRIGGLPDRIGPGHIAIRFDPKEASQYRAFLNGEEVEDCVEFCLLGDDHNPAYVVIYARHESGQRVRCHECGGFVEHRYFGAYTIRRTEPVAE